MRKDELTEDILLSYFDSEKIKKAPAGFSSKVMSHIYMEVKPVKSESNLIVPVISMAVFMLLTIATLLVTDRTLNLPDINWPGSFNFSFPDLDSHLRIPQIMVYAIAGVVLIALLDSVFVSRFRKEKNQRSI